ncbi:MAG: UbiD family decarboxylase [Nitrososphaerota archaeon]|nr:UbiD family decarboxylase [Nitrososphaerota archaeon]
MEQFHNLNEYLGKLEQSNKLFRVSEPIVKETEVASLVRLQFRGLSDEMRRGFLFDNVRDVKGRKYDTKLATGIYASSTQIYALGLQCEPTREAIQKRWQEAQLHPVEPRLVDRAPVQEVVIEGNALLEDGKGLESLPVPVELPGYSGSIRTTTPIITKDPETGIRNMGSYSGHIFGKTKLQWEINRGNHGWIHWNMYKKLGKPMHAAVVIGGPPSLFYVASAKLPYGVDELTVVGGFNAEPIDIVKCKTVDIEVPASAEIIIEGIIETMYMEKGNAFGEYNGYMATDVWPRPPFRVTCVTHRRNPTFVHVMSQFPPSESSKVRLISSENIYFKFLKSDCKFPGILDVVWHEMSQAQWCVIKIKKTNNAIPWQILQCASGYDARWGKFYIVVDEDIDPRDLDAVVWALSWRVQPAKDMRVIEARIPGLDLSGYKQDASTEDKTFPGGVGSSAVLIDATLKWPYPPISLPKKEFMENALRMWKKLGLPDLSLKQPWYGYELGYWPETYARDADLILKGEQYKVVERLEKERVET